MKSKVKGMSVTMGLIAVLIGISSVVAAVTVLSLPLTFNNVVVAKEVQLEMTPLPTGTIFGTSGVEYENYPGDAEILSEQTYGMTFTMTPTVDIPRIQVRCTIADSDGVDLADVNIAFAETMESTTSAFADKSADSGILTLYLGPITGWTLEKDTAFSFPAVIVYNAPGTYTTTYEVVQLDA